MAPQKLVLDDEPNLIPDRGLCVRCLRAPSHCYCEDLPRLSTKTKVLFVQHPREHRMAIGTARMAHLSLPNSSLVVGLRVEDTPEIKNVLDDQDAVVLFPADDALPLDEVAKNPPKTLIVLDGTWPQARALMRENPKLSALPRVKFAPESPGNYRIRREPSDLHLATIEAVSHVLGVLENDPARFRALLTPFDKMIDRQLESLKLGHGRRRKDRHRSPGPLRELWPVLDAPERCVILYAEANAHPRAMRSVGSPELLHLVGRRPHSGAALDFLAAPQRALPDEVPLRLGIPRADILGGRAREDIVDVANMFFGPRDLLCLWGPYARDLLVAEGLSPRGFIDLRALSARTLGHAAGGIVGASTLLAPDLVVAPGSRGAGMLARIDGIFSALIDRAGAAKLGGKRAAP